MVLADVCVKLGGKEVLRVGNGAVVCSDGATLDRLSILVPYSTGVNSWVISFFQKHENSG